MVQCWGQCNMMRNQQTFILFCKGVWLIVVIFDKSSRLDFFCFMMFCSDILFFYSSSFSKPTIIITQALSTACPAYFHYILFMISLPVKSKQPFLHLLIKHFPTIICYYKNKVYLS